MTDDIVQRLRDGALSGDLPLGAAFNWSEVADSILALQRQVGEQSEQIERLRAEVAAAEAEVEAWKQDADRAWNRHLDSLARVHRLQALIDAWVAAQQSIRASFGRGIEFHAASEALYVAEQDLLAAATPQQTEGPSERSEQDGEP